MQARPSGQKAFLFPIVDPLDQPLDNNIINESESDQPLDNNVTMQWLKRTMNSF